jgi:monofunctional biosynthetic peptidoglycan transglycosylase
MSGDDDQAGGEGLAPIRRPPPPPSAPQRAGSPRSSSLFGRAFQIAGWLVVILFYGSLAWVGAYRFLKPPVTATMIERRLSGEAVAHPWTPLSEISPHLVRAVIAAEDSRFCLHKGLDFEAIDAALDDNKNGGRRRGASTISQQTAKNAFLWNGGGWARKAAEAWFTLVVETLWPKRRIIEVYLNIAEWGNGNFGAEAAARARFGKRASDLTRAEAALLAAVLPNPHKWRVDPPGPYVSRRAAMLRKRMDVVARKGYDFCARRKE